MISDLRDFGRCQVLKRNCIFVISGKTLVWESTITLKYFFIINWLDILKSLLSTSWCNILLLFISNYLLLRFGPHYITLSIIQLSTSYRIVYYRSLVHNSCNLGSNFFLIEKFLNLNQFVAIKIFVYRLLEIIYICLKLYEINWIHLRIIFFAFLITDVAISNAIPLCAFH